MGRFVLDSAVSPNQTDEQELSYDVQGFESSMDAFIEWCVSRDDCALGTDAEGAQERIADLLDDVERAPLETSRGDIDSIGEGWLGFAIFMCLYSKESWPTLNEGLAQALDGRGDILLAHAMNVVGRSASGEYDTSSYLQAMIPVRCADWSPSSADELAAVQRRARTEHPLWSQLTGLLYDNCGTWPGEVRKPSATTLAEGAAPILVIGNLRDPATPIGGTKQLAADLASGVLVTSDHDGHGTYYAGNSCVDSIVDGYLVKGTVPRPTRPVERHPARWRRHRVPGGPRRLRDHGARRPGRGVTRGAGSAAYGIIRSDHPGHGGDGRRDPLHRGTRPQPTRAAALLRPAGAVGAVC